MADLKGLAERVEEAISLSDVRVTYDSVGRRYTHIANTAEVAEVVIRMVRSTIIERLDRETLARIIGEGSGLGWAGLDRQRCLQIADQIAALSPPVGQAPDGGEVEAKVKWALSRLHNASGLGYENHEALEILLASYRSLTEQVAGLTREISHLEDVSGEAALLREEAEGARQNCLHFEARANALEVALAGREGWVLVPDRSDGAMWSAGKRTFAIYANRYRDAETTDAAIAVEDIAPEEIYRAMLSAAPALTASGEEAKPDPAGLVEALEGIRIFAYDSITQNPFPPAVLGNIFGILDTVDQALAEHRGAK